MSNFKNVLMHESGLLTLSQGDCALFLIGQANAITYRQLALTGLHDLGGRERVRHYLTTHIHRDNLLFMLFIASREDAVLFLTQLADSLSRKENQKVSLCFLDKSAELFNHPENQFSYFRKDIPTGSLWLPGLLDYDLFFGKLHLIERQV